MGLASFNRMRRVQAEAEKARLATQQVEPDNTDIITAQVMQDEPEQKPEEPEMSENEEEKSNEQVEPDNTEETSTETDEKSEEEEASSEEEKSDESSEEEEKSEPMTTSTRTRRSRNQ